MTVNTSTQNYYLLQTNVVLTPAGGADPCKGDSGGPLLLKGEDNAWQLAAVLLGGGFKCGAFFNNDTTSDWSKVSVHIPWIRSIISGRALSGICKGMEQFVS